MNVQLNIETLTLPTVVGIRKEKISQKSLIAGIGFREYEAEVEVKKYYENLGYHCYHTGTPLLSGLHTISKDNKHLSEYTEISYHSELTKILKDYKNFRGAPDLFCFNKDEFFFVEIKRGSIGSIKHEQINWVINHPGVHVIFLFVYFKKIIYEGEL